MFTKKDLKKSLLNSSLGKDPLVMYAWDLLTDNIFQAEWDIYDFKVPCAKCKPFASSKDECDFTFKLNHEEYFSEEFKAQMQRLLNQHIFVNVKFLLTEKRHLLEVLDTYAEPLYRLNLSAEGLYNMISFIHHNNQTEFDKRDNESIDAWANRLSLLYKMFA